MIAPLAGWFPPPRRGARSRAGGTACAAALAATLLAGGFVRADSPEVPLATARALTRAMSAGRSGEAEVRYRLADPFGGPARTVVGRVRVEAPDRVRLDFTSTGERIALRGDGGEWLQPAARQLLRIPSDRARSALQWWRVLLPGSRAVFREDSIAPRRFRLAALADQGSPIRIGVRLDRAGFPAEIAVAGMAEDTVTYRLSGWKFGRARGAAAYRLSAPAGYETVDLP